MKTRITIELDDDLLEQLELIQGRSAAKLVNVEELIERRLDATIEYDLAGTPLFLNDDQHRRLRQISGSSMVCAPEALLDRLARGQQISIEGEPLILKSNVLERLASRAKVFGKTPAALGREYAEAGIKERVGL